MNLEIIFKIVVFLNIPKIITKDYLVSLENN